ncbi:3-isopropylmalate dehydratase small subunit [Paraferrimonas haliotis]|uniref:3-isopropylmalate dehydratase small subunit n=1 Tax=Paraferrimonas haliotis TaxID=2013866 RepID=UPI000BA9664B|nr:3-isopropylmalate dehydratase small subunit [Paraferrimonas haliotis]
MQAFTTHKGIVATLLHNNIDTDQIIPKQFLSKVTREGFGQHLFHDWRFLDDEGQKDNPDFELNQPQNRGASILLAGDNFGCGSSREHAPWALADYGFKVIIAPSFADIFYSNAINNGLLPVRLSEQNIQVILQQLIRNKVNYIEVDLQALKVTIASGQAFSFVIEDSARHNLLNGLDTIGLTLEYKAAIERYESALAPWQAAPNHE